MPASTRRSESGAASTACTGKSGSHEHLGYPGSAKACDLGPSKTACQSIQGFALSSLSESSTYKVVDQMT